MEPAMSLGRRVLQMLSAISLVVVAYFLVSSLTCNALSALHAFVEHGRATDHVKARQERQADVYYVNALQLKQTSIPSNDIQSKLLHTVTLNPTRKTTSLWRDFPNVLVPVQQNGAVGIFNAAECTRETRELKWYEGFQQAIKTCPSLKSRWDALEARMTAERAAVSVSEIQAYVRENNIKVDDCWGSTMVIAGVRTESISISPDSVMRKNKKDTLGQGPQCHDHRWRWAAVSAFAQDYLGLKIDYAGLDVMDVGPWSGASSFMLHALGARTVHVVEIITMRAKRIAYVAKAFGMEGLKVYNMNIYDMENNLEFKQQYDVVHHSGVLYHLQNPTLALEIAKFNLRVGGWLILETLGVCSRAVDKPLSVTTPSVGNYFNPDGRSLYLWLKKAGFTKIKVGQPHSPKGNTQEMCRLVAIAS
jgi:2-polyprenyl-3-methyl-5-hydroxy-6-metoxy-1,4-benzoquinol methylase